MAQATINICNVFPEFEKRVTAFAFDWLGRHFVVDHQRKENNKPLILLLEPGAGEAMQIPVPIEAFHNSELTEFVDDALAAQFFGRWRTKDSSNIKFDKCVGYKVPLFLGGSDTVENLELTDMSIYTEICGQLRNKIRTLPEGAVIRDLLIR